MACKRSAVRSRLAPPLNHSDWWVDSIHKSVTRHQGFQVFETILKDFNFVMPVKTGIQKVTDFIELQFLDTGFHRCDGTFFSSLLIIIHQSLVFASSPSSRGLGHRPFTAVTGVRIPVGTPFNTKGLQGPLYWMLYSWIWVWNQDRLNYSPLYLLLGRLRVVSGEEIGKTKYIRGMKIITILR